MSPHLACAGSNNLSVYDLLCRQVCVHTDMTGCSAGVSVGAGADHPNSTFKIKMSHYAHFRAADWALHNWFMTVCVCACVGGGDGKGCPVCQLPWQLFAEIMHRSAESCVLRGYRDRCPAPQRRYHLIIPYMIRRWTEPSVTRRGSDGSSASTVTLSDIPLNCPNGLRESQQAERDAGIRKRRKVEAKVQLICGSQWVQCVRFGAPYPQTWELQELNFSKPQGCYAAIKLEAMHSDKSHLCEGVAVLPFNN